MAAGDRVRTRKTTVLNEPGLDNTAKPETKPTDDGWQPIEPDLWRMVAALTAEERENYWVYLYRLQPEIENQTGPAYIKRCKELTLEDVSTEFGGGVYQLRVNNETDGKFRKLIFTVDGEPKFKPGQIMKKRSASFSEVTAPAAAVPGVAVPPNANSDQIVALLREQLNKKDTTPEDMLKSSIAIMQQGSAATIEIMKSQMIAQNGSMTGNPMMDKLVTAMIDKMSGGGDKTDPNLIRIMEQQNKILETIVAKNNSGGGLNMESIVAMVPVIQQLTGKAPADLLKSIFGSGGGAVAEVVGGGKMSLQETILNGLNSALEKAPELLDSFNRMRNDELNRQMAETDYKISRGLLTPPAATAPANPNAPPPAAAPPQLQPAPAQPNPQPGGRVITMPPTPVVTTTPAPPRAAAPVNVVEAGKGPATPGNTASVAPNGAPAVPLTPQQEAQVQNFINQVVFPSVMGMFAQGLDGEAASQWMRFGFPQHAQYLAKQLGAAPVSVIVSTAVAWPVFAPVAKQEGFEEFVREFVTTLLNPGDTDDTANDKCPKCGVEFKEGDDLTEVDGVDYHEKCAPEEKVTAPSVPEKTTVQ